MAGMVSRSTWVPRPVVRRELDLARGRVSCHRERPGPRPARARMDWPRVLEIAWTYLGASGCHEVPPEGSAGRGADLSLFLRSSQPRRLSLSCAALAFGLICGAWSSTCGRSCPTAGRDGPSTMRQTVLLSAQARRGFRSLRWLASVSRVATTPRSFET